jgi:hypothetical protein
MLPELLMKVRVRSDLKFWINVEVGLRRSCGDDRHRHELVTAILLDWERRGDAMRYLDTSGQVRWKPSPKILQHWRDQEAEAEADWDD